MRLKEDPILQSANTSPTLQQDNVYSNGYMSLPPRITSPTHSTISTCSESSTVNAKSVSCKSTTSNSSKRRYKSPYLGTPPGLSPSNNPTIKKATLINQNKSTICYKANASQHKQPVSTTPPKIAPLKEVEKMLSDLRKENFDLKLRIYYYEDVISKKLDTFELNEENQKLKIIIENKMKRIQELEAELSMIYDAALSFQHGVDKAMQTEDKENYGINDLFNAIHSAHDVSKSTTTINNGLKIVPHDADGNNSTVKKKNMKPSLSLDISNITNTSSQLVNLSAGLDNISITSSSNPIDYDLNDASTAVDTATSPIQSPNFSSDIIHLTAIHSSTVTDNIKQSTSTPSILMNNNSTSNVTVIQNNENSIEDINSIQSIPTSPHSATISHKQSIADSPTSTYIKSVQNTSLFNTNNNSPSSSSALPIIPNYNVTSSSSNVPQNNQHYNKSNDNFVHKISAKSIMTKTQPAFNNSTLLLEKPSIFPHERVSSNNSTKPISNLANNSNTIPSIILNDDILTSPLISPLMKEEGQSSPNSYHIITFASSPEAFNLLTPTKTRFRQQSVESNQEVLIDAFQNISLSNTNLESWLNQNITDHEQGNLKRPCM